MLIVATVIQPSPIHGLGCFLCEKVEKGAVVWLFDPEVDHELRVAWAATWEWNHGYRTLDGRLILPRDNACWMNFDNPPSLEEKVIEGDPNPALVAAYDLVPGDELTVGKETDADHDLKIMAREWPASPTVSRLQASLYFPPHKSGAEVSDH